MHKIITIWIGRGADNSGRKHKSLPYTDTEMSIEESIAKIKVLLKRFGCQTIIDYQKEGIDPKHGVLSYNTIGFEKDGLKYMIEFPITFVEHSLGKRLNMGISGRIVYNRIKALLVDAEIEYLTFHEAMLPYLALPTPHGTMSVMEVVQSQIAQIREGTSGLFLLPGGRT